MPHQTPTGSMGEFSEPGLTLAKRIWKWFFFSSFFAITFVPILWSGSPNPSAAKTWLSTTAACDSIALLLQQLLRLK
ncbi:rCG55863, partial [Rattus norvegicus]